ncbi:MAG: sterol desaturase family protein [Elusimicrobiota bacterium]|nr:MAG: sterol desaturase family protein [Elusimicrobiota bacterium]
MSLRFAAFALSLLVWGLAERALPRRARVDDPARRWKANLGLVAAGWAVHLLIPFALVGAASRAEAAGVGLLHQTMLPYPLKFVLALVALDLAIYLQHRAFHWSPALWRLHAVHHSDLDLDASSGVRFHPGELVLSTLYKLAVVVLLGAHFAAVAVFELILVSASIFNHSNTALPGDRFLRLLVVTPDMHRVHHSPSREETDSNFGFFLPWWDRLFRSYRAQPAEPHESMTLGLAGARDGNALGFWRLLARPFRSAA